MAEYKGDFHVRMTAEEMDRVHCKMDELGIKSINAYFRKMALDGYCVKLNIPQINELRILLRRCSNNLNQYAKRANETGSIYKEDIQDLQIRMDEIWEAQKEILVSLSKIT